MGVYVILDGVRREYPSADGWRNVPTGIEITRFEPLLFPSGNIMDTKEIPICVYGRYDLVGWMEDEK